MTDAVLTLIAPAALKEDIAGALLAQPVIARRGFTIHHVEGHGDAIDYDRVIEQVRGYTSVVEIVATAPEPVLHEVLEAIGSEFAGRGIRWRIVAVEAWGTI
ncbi:DUF3240 family protein [Rhodopseudomonas sp. B29]|uniref:DUF3240 family protein n=1 Tax=Rhodopseudomonas sp. B29 TaxID=95607 RepID=UPI00034641C1|nr:DUF3240 family protein [Rhodopseudomonas sp. B29]